MLELNKVILEDLQNVCTRKINWDKFRNASVLVTGANGLIATYIIYMLLYLNEYQDMGIQVIGLARSPQKVAQRYGSLLERDDFRMIYQDVTKPLQAEGAVDYIIHTASPTGPKQFMDTPVDTILANVAGA